MDYLPPPGKLLNTNSTQAILPEVPGWIGTKMIIVPDNIGLERTYAFHDLRLQVRHLNPQSKKTDPAHSDSWLLHSESHRLLPPESLVHLFQENFLRFETRSPKIGELLPVRAEEHECRNPPGLVFFSKQLRLRIFC